MKYCTTCGKENEDAAKVCVQCGKEFEEVQAQDTVAFVAPKKAEKFAGLAVAGFVLSLIGLLILPIIMGPLGLIFSSIGLKQTLGGNKRGKGLAIAGLVMAIIDLAWLIISL